MAPRIYRILVGESTPAIRALAGDEWTILESTIKEFASLDTTDDDAFGDIGAVVVEGPGVIALAWQQGA